jgi:hypothetical protein
MKRIIALVSFLFLGSLPASAGCIGGAVGDACIGLPTPHRHVYRDPDDHRSVVIERHRYHRHPPVVIERHYDEDED